MLIDPRESNSVVGSPIILGGFPSADGGRESAELVSADLSGRLVVDASRRSVIVRSFCEELASDPPEVTEIVDYFHWHADGIDWGVKDHRDGLFASVTRGELASLWSEVHMFIPYEARLLRFQREGGRIERTFLLDADIRDPGKMLLLQRTIFRHAELGFAPRVRTCIDLSQITRETGVNFDACGILNGKLAVFLRLPRSCSQPSWMIRTTNAKIVSRIKESLHRFWVHAEHWGTWYSRQTMQFKEEVELDLQRDLEAVRSIAHNPRDKSTPTEKILRIDFPRIPGRQPGGSFRPNVDQWSTGGVHQANPLKRGARQDLAKRAEVTIAIIAALPKEHAALQAALKIWREDNVPGRGAGRRYHLGSVPAKGGGRHRLVLALADMGNNVASARATLLLEHYQNVTGVIMVGIAGGVPEPAKPDDHVRLGDIVVSDKRGVIQYDMKKLQEIRSCPIPPRASLLEAVRLLQCDELSRKRPWLPRITKILRRLQQSRPDPETDVLHSPESPFEGITHPADPKRLRNLPRVFIGPIASANELLKDPQKRDQLRDKFGVKAVEMESSGIADASWGHDEGYLVVRGICDYCDSFKNDVWQEYAAAVSAGYTISLIESMPVMG